MKVLLVSLFTAILLVISSAQADVEVVIPPDGAAPFSEPPKFYPRLIETNPIYRWDVPWWDDDHITMQFEFQFTALLVAPGPLFGPEHFQCWLELQRWNAETNQFEAGAGTLGEWSMSYWPDFDSPKTCRIQLNYTNPYRDDSTTFRLKAYVFQLQRSLTAIGGPPATDPPDNIYEKSSNSFMWIVESL